MYIRTSPVSFEIVCHARKIHADVGISFYRFRQFAQCAGTPQIVVAHEDAKATICMIDKKTQIAVVAEIRWS
ncbi:MAG: hypothetical protein WDM87_08940 [Terracidiphilus sp.]